MTTEPSLRDIGRGISQLHQKVSRMAEALGGGSGAKDAQGDRAQGPDGSLDGSLKGWLEGWLDLIDAVDAAVERRSSTPPPKRGFWQRSTASADPNAEVWRGLQVAAAEAHERISRMGIDMVPETGTFDPRWHRAIETLPSDDPSLKGTIAATHQRGWMRRPAAPDAPPVVLRTALVSVYQA